MEALCYFLQLERQIGWDGEQETPSLCFLLQGGESHGFCLSLSSSPLPTCRSNEEGKQCCIPVSNWTGSEPGQAGLEQSEGERQSWVDSA